MQNLKRLNGGGSTWHELFEPERATGTTGSWPRTCGRCSRPRTRTVTLIVGDSRVVESRGLAWLAGEQWKLDAYRKGQDLYKVQAGKIFGKSATERHQGPASDRQGG